MLCCYAEELREGFLPYVQPVTEIMVPLLKFWFHEEVGVNLFLPPPLTPTLSCLRSPHSLLRTLLRPSLATPISHP